MGARSEWKQHWQRIKRWRKRIDDISLEVSHVNESFDIIYAFFVNCWHLIDWVVEGSCISQRVQDKKSNQKEIQEITKKIDSDYPNLVICRRIANHAKHFRLRQASDDSEEAYVRLILKSNTSSGVSVGSQAISMVASSTGAATLMYNNSSQPLISEPSTDDGIETWHAWLRRVESGPTGIIISDGRGNDYDLHKLADQCIREWKDLLIKIGVGSEQDFT